MRATVWGCRGSIASPGETTVRYGGNTPCVELRPASGPLIVLDAGTGIRRLGEICERDGVRKAHLVLTHLHLDHIEGLGFFSPLWRHDVELDVWGPSSPVESLASRIARYLSPPLFPVALAEVPGRLTFHDVPDDQWAIGSVSLRAEPISHPGPTVGYRLEEDGRSLAYLPDHEPALAGQLGSRPPEWVSGFSLAEHVDVLVHDAQFTELEYEARVGWGHSSVAHAVQFARLAQVGRLLLFHHDPTHSDTDLDRIAEHARELWGDDGAQPQLAFEGLHLDL
jgi:phosphoribosyl 1,2-cyclic phosphodiesterase